MRIGMKIRLIKNCSTLALLGCSLLSLGLTGCQTSVGGQTLPSASYLRDDVQFHPAGPEDQLPRQKAALQAYKLQREGFLADE